MSRVISRVIDLWSVLAEPGCERHVTSVSDGSASEPLKGPEGDRLALSL